jgi:dipeptidyl aminopeptidase/acylaminoacyl peptidase
VFNKTCSHSLVALLVSGFAGVRADERPSAKRAIDVLTGAMAGMHGYGQVAVSPDGRYVAWVGGRGRGRSSGPSGICVTDLKSPGSQPKQITAGGRAEQSLAWSPDSTHLAFFSDKEKNGQVQLFVAEISTGKAVQRTNLKGALARPRWSPDGRSIGLLFIENATRPPGPLQPVPAETGVIGEKVQEQRLTTVEVETGKTQHISPADIYVYEFDWSPDSKTFVITAAHGSGENNWYVAEIYALPAGGGELSTILKPEMQIGVPRWSPDGRTVAFIGGLMSDEGFIGGDVYAVPATGGRPAKCLTPDLKATATWITWLAPSNRILFAETVDGGTGIATVDPESGEVQTLWTGPESFSATIDAYGPGVSVSKDGRVSALVRQSFERPPEVWAGPIGQWEALTNANRERKPLWGETKSLHWKSDEWTVQGWLQYPYKYEPNRQYPMVVVPHGGPTGCVIPSWPGADLDSLLSYQGYFVFLPNFRGSTGQGEKFVRANVRDFGYGDLRDIMTGVDEVLKTVPVDKDRLGMTGGSYGGFMTMWTVTQTQRFRAAVAVAGISNWQSYYGQNGIDQWMIPFFGASVYDDPAVYARSSPINFIKSVKTPTLVLVGEHDIECPVPQSYEFWRALKRHGVPAELVVYPGEGHGFYQAKHRRDYQERTLAWFEKYLKTPTHGNGQGKQESRP